MEHFRLDLSQLKIVNVLVGVPGSVVVTVAGKTLRLCQWNGIQLLVLLCLRRMLSIKPHVILLS